MVLAQNDGLTQDELTKIVKVDKAATARRIRSLEKKKLFFEKLTLRIKDWTVEQYEMVYQSLEQLQNRFEFHNK